MQDYRSITGYIWFYFDYILTYFSPFLPPKLLFLRNYLLQTLETIPIDSARPETEVQDFQAVLMHFSYSKSRKC